MANSKEKMSAVMDLRGIDMVTPVDLISNGRTPYSKNFRLYAQQSDDRRVAVSSRKGPGYYITPLGETLSASNTASTGASTAKVGVITGQHAQPFTAPSNDRITRIDVQVYKEETATGPLMVQIWSDNGGPAKLLSESSLLSGNIGVSAAYVTARFVNAVKMTSGATYWIVLVMQDDGKNNYTLTTTTAGTHAWKTDSALSAIEEQSYAINYRLYTAVDGADKGSYRLNRENADNRTLVAYGDTMYRIDEASHSLVKLVDGLNVNASEYRFTNGDNKAFWVNGYDDLTAWNGTYETDNPNLVTNGSFDSNTSGWAIDDSETIARDTTTYHSSPASLKVSGGYPEVNYNMNLDKNKRYLVTFWVNPVNAGSIIFEMCNVAGTGNAGNIASKTTAVTAGSWQKIQFYMTPYDQDVKRIRLIGNSMDYYIDDVSIVETGIEYIRDPELPILSDIIMHKDRLWGVVAADRNKLVFSENPGNPAFNPTGTIATTAREQWYYAWLSVSFWYVPRPFNGSPITALVSFQDALTIFTQDNKYVLSGYDRGSLNLRQSTGVKGALSRRGVVSDENRIYFVSDDGFYEHNGSADTKLSTLILPLFDGCGHKEMITPVMWKNQVRFYMASEGSAVNDLCAIWDKNTEEMLLDTDVYVNRALYYNDADDNDELVEFSSLVPTAYLAEQDYNSLGGPIDFEYRFNYDSMGSPMQRKRLKRFYPILQGVDSTFTVNVDMDKDFEDSPKLKEQQLVVNGAKIGEFVIGDGTLLGGDKSFKPKRQSYSGYAYYWQLRVRRKGVNNRVALVGAQYAYKTKRL